MLEWLQVTLHPWHSWLGTAASIYAVVLHFVMVAQIVQSVRNRSVEDLSVAIPVGSTVLFALWMLFGLSIHDPFIFAPDIFGVLVGGVMVSVYIALKRGAPRYALKLAVACVLVLWIGLLLLHLLGQLHRHSELLGIFALVGSFAGHAMIVMQILKTAKRKRVKDIVSALPFGTLGSYLVWLLYALATSNGILEISSTIGLALTGILCVQYLVYRRAA